MTGIRERVFGRKYNFIIAGREGDVKLLEQKVNGRAYRSGNDYFGELLARELADTQERLHALRHDLQPLKVRTIKRGVEVHGGLMNLLRSFYYKARGAW